MDKFKITVFCEIKRDGTAAQVSYELAAKASSLAKNIENSEVQILIIGKRMNYDSIIDNFSKLGADKVIIVNDNVFADYSLNLYRKAACEILAKEKPQIVLFGATVFGRGLAPLTATELKTGLTADCTGLEIIDGKLEATRPTFGGKMNATILCKTSPQMATVREGVFAVKAEDFCMEKDTVVNFDWVDTSEEKSYTNLLEIIPDYFGKNNDLAKAEIILAGGRGLKNKENFDKLFELASKTGASVGASRGAVDAGFADPSIQIGQTGKTVNAKIYVAFGISGMNQHLVGINSCDKIIAVNNDINAPVFKHSDINILGDAAEIIENMLDKYKS